MTQPTSPTTPRSPSYGYQPLCFHKDVFGSAHFNVESFIADCRKRVPLESVRTDLVAYMQALEGELVELINKDYTDFVSLSANLAGIDTVLQTIKAPIQDINNQANVFLSSLSSVLSSGGAQASERQALALSVRYLLHFIHLDHTTTNLHNLLNTKITQEEKKDGDAAAFIDRLANEYNMFRFYLSQVQKLPPAEQGILDQFSQKTTLFTTRLDQEVSRQFRTAITSFNSPNSANSACMEEIGACLRLYGALNKASSAYAIYRELVVRPKVIQIITVSNLEKGSRGTCEGLKGVCDSLLQFIKAECCPFLAFINRHFEPSQYDFLSNSIWVEIEEAIYTKIGKIYAPGIPEIFHQNYKACFAFLSQLEDLACYTFDGLTAFRSHASYQAFERRWNTSVYFQLRFTEIASKVEASLSQEQQMNAQNQPQPPSTSSEPSFLLVGSTVLWRELTRIWSPNVFLYGLTRQFMKLTLQLLSRYSSWIYASYANPSTSTPSSPPISDSLKNSASINLAENLDEPAAAIWSKLVPGAYAYLYHDLVVLVSNLQDENKTLDIKLKGQSFIVTIENALKADSDCDADLVAELIATIRLSLSTASSSLLTHQSHLANAITSNLTKKAIDSLQPLLGVTATYRLSDKRLPTRANYYVDDVVAVLQTFYQTHSPNIPLPILREWQRKVLEDVTAKYEGMVTDILNNAHNAAKVLSKLVKKKTTVQAGISDIDKTSLQLYLDVEQYGNLLKSKLNLDSASFPPYISLLAKVQDGAKFKGVVSENV